MTDKSINAGVDAQTGFALQRNSALYLLLEEYHSKFKEKKYFICLEHHDDFLFCFLNDKDEAEIIEAYQSKKKSPDTWKLDNTLINIISKLLKTGKYLISDKFPKSSSYKHFLYFTTNQTTNLVVKEKKKVIASVSIKENNQLVSYKSLDKEIKSKINNKIKDKTLVGELNNLQFIYIDLNRTVEKQINELVGQLGKVFGNSIYNKEAAVKSLIELFRGIEEKYNNGNVAKLLDTTKRVTSSQIEDTFCLLTSKSKCFNYWRTQKREVSRVLKIKPTDRETFEFAFDTAFDFFKSYNQAEHRKILEYVKLKLPSCLTFTDEDNVNELITMYSKTDSTLLGEIEFKAVVFAAFFEVTFKH